MRDGWLGDRDVQDLARQAVDLLYPPAQVTVDALNGRGRRIPQWGGLSMGSRRPRRVTVSIAPGDRCIIGIDPDWTPVQTLAHLVDQLGGACDHKFRGRWFPPCPGHDHAADVDPAEETVMLRCPQTGQVTSHLRPDLNPATS